MKITAVTFLYPDAKQFIDSFIKSLAEQRDCEFDLMVFNDQVENAEALFSKYPGKIRFHKLKGTPLSIRFKALKYLADFSDTKFIFCDIDDAFSFNRISKLSLLLEDFQLVCNDLTITDSNGLTLIENLWSKRLGSRFKFNHKFIERFNIVGFGNTAIRSELLKTKLDLTKKQVAPDWFIFYQLLFKSNANCLFTDEAVTYYRQHDANMAGLAQQISLQQLSQMIKMKQLHYTALEEIGIVNSALFEELKNLVNHQKEQVTYHIECPFWWEVV